MVTLWSDDGEREEKSGADRPPYNVSHQLGLAISGCIRRRACDSFPVISLFILSYLRFLFSLVAVFQFVLT